MNEVAYLLRVRRRWCANPPVFLIYSYANTASYLTAIILPARLRWKWGCRLTFMCCSNEKRYGHLQARIYFIKLNKLNYGFIIEVSCNKIISKITRDEDDFCISSISLMSINLPSVFIHSVKGIPSIKNNCLLMGHIDALFVTF